MNDFPTIALAAVDIVTLCTAIGVLACLIWIVPPPPERRPGPWTGPVWRLFGASLALLTLNSVALLVVRSHALSGQPYSALAPVMAVVLRNTHYGNVWLVRVASIAVLWPVWWAGRARPYQRLWPWLLLAGIAVTAFTRSASSHAADQGDFTPHEIMDWLHILVVSLWGGAVVAATLTLFGGGGDSARPAFNVLAYRLSALATAALPLVLATGVYNAWKQFTAVDQLWQSDYGRHFLLKIVLVVMMLTLGAINRFAYLNRLSRPEPAGRSPAGGPSCAGDVRMEQSFRRMLYVEAVVAVAVFIAVAVMVNTAPPHAGGMNM